MTMPMHVNLFQEHWDSITYGTGSSNQRGYSTDTTLENNDWGYYAVGGILIYGGNPGDKCFQALDTPLSAGGIAFGFTIVSITGSDNTILLVKGATSDLFKVYAPTVSTVAIAEWNGSAWVQVGSDYTMPVSSHTGGNRFDFQFDMDNSAGVLKLLVNGAVAINETARDTILTADTEVTDIEVHAPSTLGHAMVLHFLFIEDDAEALSRFVVDERTTTSNGNTNTGVGFSEANVDERFGQYLDSNYGVFNANGQKEDFNMAAADEGITTSHTIEEVWVAAYVKADVEPGFEIDGYVRVGSTDYLAGAKVAPRGGQSRIDYWRFPTDPSTAAAWVDIDVIDGIKCGVEAFTP